MNERDLALEHRLTSLEVGQGALRTQIAVMESAIVTRLDKQNGSVARHFQEDAAWQRDFDSWREKHDKAEARAGGVMQGRTATLGALLVGVTLVAGLVDDVLKAWIFG